MRRRASDQVSEVPGDKKDEQSSLSERKVRCHGTPDLVTVSLCPSGFGASTSLKVGISCSLLVNRHADRRVRAQLRTGPSRRPVLEGCDFATRDGGNLPTGAQPASVLRCPDSFALA
jgi:hypothetical protein